MTHKLAVTGGLVAAIVGGWLSVSSARQSGDPGSRFQAAMHRETVVGDLPGAMAEYRQLAETVGDRALVSQVLLRLAGCHEKLGQQEALIIYQRLTQEYGDQDKVAALARRRIDVLTSRAGASTPTAAPASRLVWGEGADTSWNSVSADGRWLTFVDEAEGLNLRLRDLQNGDTRSLTTDARTGVAEVWYHAISPDGRWVVYTWNRFEGQKPLPTELHLVASDGTARRRLATAPENVGFENVIWSPDQRHVAVCASKWKGEKQIVLVTIRDGSTRALRSDPVKGLFPVAFSSDSRHLLFNAAPWQTDAFDILMLDLDEALQPIGERALIAGESSDTAVAWSADQRHVLFLSNRTGSKGLWRLPVKDAAADGAPVLVRDQVADMSVVGLTRDGTLVHGLTHVQRNAMIGEIDLATGRVVTPATNATPRYVDVTSALGWSPDGSQFAYQNADNLIVVRDERTGREREVRPAVEDPWHTSWHPDGRSMVINARGQDQRYGIYQVSLADGSAKLLLASPENQRLPGGSVGPDGDSLFILPEWNHLAVRSLRTGTQRTVFRAPGEHAFWGGAISRDGMRLGLTQPSTLWTVLATGGDVAERMTLDMNLKRWFGGITWTPDGKHLLVLVNQQGRGPHELLLFPGAGGQPKSVESPFPTPPGKVPWAHLRNLFVHPDGRRIASTVGALKNEVWVLEHFLPR